MHNNYAEQISRVQIQPIIHWETRPSQPRPPFKTRGVRANDRPALLCCPACRSSGTALRHRCCCSPMKTSRSYPFSSYFSCCKPISLELRPAIGTKRSMHQIIKSSMDNGSNKSIHSTAHLT